VASQLGKRFSCPTCGTETLCTKPGTGTVECCGQELQIKDPKKLASSD
jgi:transcription elongation factor Elf1